jgi:hypothetical protein
MSFVFRVPMRTSPEAKPAVVIGVEIDFFIGRTLLLDFDVDD